MYGKKYVSSAVKSFTRSELRELLAVCVANNRPLEITGMLLYKDGNFMQVLEGDEASWRGVHEKILRDPRHRGLINLLQGDQGGRQFPTWSMAFRDLESAECVATPGYSEFLNTPLTSQAFADPSRCQKLLRTFKNTL